MGMIQHIIFGWIIGLLAGSLLTIYAYDLHKKPDLGEMQRRVDSYRMCMESAGSTHCHMTPEDFIDYYDLKYRILQLEEGE